MKRFLLSIVLASLSFTALAQNIILVKNGSPKATISPSNDFAIKQVTEIFNNYIQAITGTELPIKKAKKNLCIEFILIDPANNTHPEFRELKDESLREDAFSIKLSNGSLTFSAITPKGLENAIYCFMEKFCNLRLYAHDAEIIPKTNTLEIPAEISLFEAPAFSFRIPYYYEATYNNYIKWHKLSSEPKTINNSTWPVSRKWGLWVHTLHRLLPPGKWFQEHPEYFALRNGIRTTDQLCLSNPDVAELVYQSLKREIDANPTAKYWSVSQMDNYNYCECPNCMAIDSIEQSHSGTMIRFVNELAGRIPDKVISTLAYQYTRSAPKITKPLSNVNIMLCTIECDRSKPIKEDNREGSFYHDLQSWTSLTNNIIIWDYVINFSHLLVPFPNLQILDDNLRLFHEAGVSMIFEQGLRGTGGGEMNELRTYLLSKLMWNPYLNVDSLTKDFVTGYYGAPAAPYILEYLSKCNSELHKSGKALTLYEPPATHSHGYLSAENMEEYFNLFDKALGASAGDEIACHRINMAIQPLRYAWLEVAKLSPFTDNWLFTSTKPYKIKEQNKIMLEQLTSIASQYGPELFHEIRLSPGEYMQAMTDYFENGIVDHTGIGKSLTYIEMPDPKYTANGENTLIDGVKGTSAYQLLWQGWQGRDCEVIIDLNEITPVKEVSAGYLDENQSWILAPTSITVYESKDGQSYNIASEAINPSAGKQLNPHTGKLTAKFINPLNTRYLKVIIHNIGKLPKWRGVNGNSWIFIDEIEVH